MVTVELDETADVLSKAFVVALKLACDEFSRQVELLVAGWVLPSLNTAVAAKLVELFSSIRLGPWIERLVNTGAKSSQGSGQQAGPESALSLPEVSKART